MAEQKFTQEHVDALNKAIEEKRANPGMAFITDAINTFAQGAGAAAVAALIGASARPEDPEVLKGKVPQEGFSLDELVKARDHALQNSK